MPNFTADLYLLGIFRNYSGDEHVDNGMNGSFAPRNQAAQYTGPCAANFLYGALSSQQIKIKIV